MREFALEAFRMAWCCNFSPSLNDFMVINSRGGSENGEGEGIFIVFVLFFC